MVLGHDRLIGELSTYLPPVTLIQGPASVGKKLIAAQVAINMGIERMDFLQVPVLTSTTAGEVKNFFSTFPSGKYKMVSIDLDGAQSSAVDKLLILLENPPEYAKVVLLCQRTPAKTLQTRSVRYFVGNLRPADVEAILVKQGVASHDATQLKNFGTIEPAMQAYNRSPSVITAINILSAVESQDQVLLLQAYRAADDGCASLVLRALQESAASKWVVFRPEQLGGFANKKVALKLLGAWSSISPARPLLALRVILESAMRG